MSEPRWTKGPWQCSGANRVVDDRGGEVAVATRADPRNRHAAEANARLIAAAPDMADALAKLLPILEAVRYTAGLGKNQMERVEAAKRALARARGETP